MNDWHARWLLETEASKRLKHLFDGHGLILFFKKGKDYFGATEDGRMVFARMKNPDDETPVGWGEEANFTAFNLGKLARGEHGLHVFDQDDLKKIKVVDEDEAAEAVRGAADEETVPDTIRVVSLGTPPGRDDAPNLTRTQEC